MEPIGNTLKLLRNKIGLQQSEVVVRLKSLGIDATQQKISRWENNRNYPSIEQFMGLCEIYGVKDAFRLFVKQDFTEPCCELNREGREKLEDYKQLLICSGLYRPGQPDRKIIAFPKRTLPRFDVGVSAGTGQFLDTPDYEMIDVPDEVPITATFCVQVNGNSMEPTFDDGDYIWVHQQPTLDNGDIGVFYVDGNSYVKEYSVTEQGVFLVSHNEKYAPIRITELSDARIFGKVVYPV